MNKEEGTFQTSLSRYLNVDATQSEALSGKFTNKLLAKGTFLVQQSQECKSLDFVKSGVIRIYATLESGKEITQWISLPGSFVTEISSLFFDMPARWNIQCVTDCEFYSISKKEYKSLSSSVDNWGEIERAFMAKCFVTLEDRVFGFLSMTAEERYEQLMQYAPEVFQSASQQYVASMLGMTPETFSRIRKKITS